MAAASETGIPVCITPIPITGTIGCSIPVVPGTPSTDAPMEDRTELCAVDVNWIIGAAPTCDVHLKVVCEIMEWDWDGVLAEAGRDPESADRPWEGRQRHSQEDAAAHRNRFVEQDR